MMHLKPKFASALAVFFLLFGSGARQFAAQAGDSKPQRATTLLRASLPPNMDGDKLHVALVKVHYGPGGFSHPHSHGCPVIVYVLNGTVRSQIKGQPVALYHAGDTFYEPPNGVHLVSANAANNVQAEFLAFFVCSGDAAMSVPSNPPSGDKE